MAWSHDVVRLQEVDLERIKIHAQCAEIRAALEDDEGVLAAKRTLTILQENAAAIRKTQENLEFELGKVQGKASLTQEKLYSGRVTNARELQDLQNEAEALKRRNAELEDQILDVMMTREQADQGAADALASLNKSQSQSASHHQVLQAELDALQTQDQSLQTEREALITALPPAIFETYTYLLNRTANRPVAQLKGRQCGTCGMDVSPSVAQKAHHGEEAYCGGCRRLIVSLD